MAKRNDKKVEKEDEILEEFEEYEEEIDEESESELKKWALYGGVAIVSVVAVIALYFFWSSGEEEKTAEASLALAKISDFYVSGDYNKALYGDSTLAAIGEESLGLVSIVEEYGGTAPGKRAALWAGDAFFKSGDYESAKEYYDLALDSDSKLIKVGANAGVAACLEMEGELEEAAEHYMNAATLTTEPGTKARYSYYSALCFEQAGNKEEAEKIYSDIINEDEYSEFANFAKTGLYRIGTEID